MFSLRFNLIIYFLKLSEGSYFILDDRNLLVMVDGGTYM